MCGDVGSFLTGALLQAQLGDAQASQAEQQQADADMQTSNARQHAQEMAELHRQLQAAQDAAQKTEARSAAVSEVLLGLSRKLPYEVFCQPSHAEPQAHDAAQGAAGGMPHLHGRIAACACLCL